LKKIALFGSTGSIGKQVLEICDLYLQKIKIISISGKNNFWELIKISEKFAVKKIHLFEEKIFQNIKKQKNFEEKIKKIFGKNGRQKFKNLKFFFGKDGLQILAADPEINLAVIAIPGEISVLPTISAITAKKNLAVASKEIFVTAGKKIQQLRKKFKVKIFPIDSEISAIWQAIRGEKKNSIKKIFLTCSGGPFFNAKLWPSKKMNRAKISEVLNHPNWKMGKKILVDSATLMNKAFEFIEIVRFFEISPQKIEVVVHPESKIHSAVEFCDGSILAQISPSDMRSAISLALFGGTRFFLPFARFSFFDQKKLTFFPVDEKRFPSIKFAKIALRKGEKFCQKLLQTNDKAVEKFLNGEISFGEVLKSVNEIF